MARRELLVTHRIGEHGRFKLVTSSGTLRIEGIDGDVAEIRARYDAPGALSDTDDPEQDGVVEIRREGDPGPVPAGVGLTAYRVVQEALTNVSRHAGPATACVHLAVSPDGVDVRVTDDGRGAAAVADARASADGSGHGLVGMRERVGLYGGTVAAGPRPGGGYEVRARIPENEDGNISIWVWVFSGAMIVLAVAGSVWWYVLR